MPVIPCPDCGREVSTLAPACPQCGRPSPGGNAVPPAPSVPQHEETLWRATPAWALLLGHIIAMAATLILVPVLTYAGAANAIDLEARSRTIWAGWLLTLALIVLQLLIFVIRLMKLRSTIYTVTNQRVMIETGLLSKALSEIDLRYIDDSQFSQTLIQRLLGIGNVTIVSTDKTTPVYVLHAVRDPRNVRELIRAHAYKVSQRQIFTRAT